MNGCCRGFKWGAAGAARIKNLESRIKGKGSQGNSVVSNLLLDQPSVGNNTINRESEGDVSPVIGGYDQASSALP